MAPEATSPLLYLVGTVHRDPCGEDKLLALLKSLQPAEITLEMSPAALEYRLRRAATQLRRLEEILERLALEVGRTPPELGSLPVIEDIRRLLELPFEYRAAVSCAEERGISLHLIDCSEVSASKLKRVDGDLITYRNLRILIDHPACDLTDRGSDSGEGYRIARAMIREAMGAEMRRRFLEGRRGAEGIGPRDRKMAETIRARLEASGSGPLVHVGGWVHLVEDERGETLYSRLRDLRPRRLLLEGSG